MTEWSYLAVKRADCCPDGQRLKQQSGFCLLRVTVMSLPVALLSAFLHLPLIFMPLAC